MRPLKNTLYVQTQNAWLNKDGENIVLNVEREVKGRIPIHKIDGIVCFGQVSLSPALMAHCTASNITITFLNQFGKFQARVEGAVSGNVLLRREQYRIADDSERSLVISQTIILGKVFNQRQVIRRYLRDYKDSLDTDSQSRLDKAQKYLELGLNRVVQTQNNAELLGREGELAGEYFAVFPRFIRHSDFDFAKRTRNPPTDPVNALLSFAYTLMTHECRSALETVGLDPDDRAVGKELLELGVELAELGFLDPEFCPDFVAIEGHVIAAPQQLEQSLMANLSNFWQAYRNNLEVIQLETENLIAARENYEIAMERYLLGDLPGIEMREAQKSLLDAEERILTAQYNTKLCEISLQQISGNIGVYLQ